MTDFLDGLGDVLISGAKGAAAGAALGPIGAGAGGLIGLASSLVPHVFGADAQAALSAAAKVATGADDEASQVQILSTDSAALAAYKVQALKIAADREQAQLDAQTDQITASFGDVADARQQTVNLAKTGSQISWGAPAVSIVVVIGLFASFAGLLWVKRIDDAGVAAMINTIIGALVLAFGGIVRYWTGGAQDAVSSARKTEIIAQSMPASALPKPLAVAPAADVKN